jgi:hypothetical protein
MTREGESMTISGFQKSLNDDLRRELEKLIP